MHRDNLTREFKSFMNANREHQCDVLVVGSGAAGLSLALRVAEYGKVIVLSKGLATKGQLTMLKAVSPQSLTNQTVSSLMSKIH